MKDVMLLGLACSGLLLAGCSKSANNDAAGGGPDAYGGKIKTLVYELVKTVGNNPKTAAEQGSVLLEELEVYESQPVGDHQETYASLLQKCQDLVAAGKSGSKDKVTATLREMKALADKLPGKAAS
jgi:hypothetical protein